MAYFSNGTEGMSYMDNYCANCIHANKCPVMGIHLIYNGDQSNNEELKGAMDMLIPSKDGHPQECAMFVKDDGKGA